MNGLGSPVSSGLAARSNRVSSSTPLASAQGLEVGLDQVALEAVDAGRHGGVGGEHGAGPGPGDRGVPVGAVGQVGLELLQEEEAGVALVEVDDLGFEVEGLQGPDAADAEDQLLVDAVLVVARVEAVGDGSTGGGVGGEVGVEGVEVDPADRQAPHLGFDGVVADLDRDGDAGVDEAELFGVAGLVALGLVVAVELLAEEALPVEEADADEGQTEVGGRLEVITGQDPEPARVLRDQLGDAELGRHVGHLGPGWLVGQAGHEVVVSRRDGGRPLGIGGHGVPVGLADGAGRGHRVGGGIGAREGSQYVGCDLIPGPAVVPGQVHDLGFQGGGCGIVHGGRSPWSTRPSRWSGKGYLAPLPSRSDVCH